MNYNANINKIFNSKLNSDIIILNINNMLFAIFVISLITLIVTFWDFIYKYRLVATIIAVIAVGLFLYEFIDFTIATKRGEHAKFFWVERNMEKPKPDTVKLIKTIYKDTCENKNKMPVTLKGKYNIQGNLQKSTVGDNATTTNH